MRQEEGRAVRKHEIKQCFPVFRFVRQEEGRAVRRHEIKQCFPIFRFVRQEESEVVRMREMDICEYVKTRSGGDILVDLRSSTLYRFGTVPGAVNIPVERIGELYRLPKEKPVFLFCQYGEISRQFAELLSDAGYDACHLAGGYQAYLRDFLGAGADGHAPAAEDEHTPAASGTLADGFNRGS